ncbi:phage shock protein operon transcriptional activator [Abyssibacter sp.]|jgi:psp operon transcriptional activator|uniref:phage shock protein operon transcriptional activator n=1 Tax=Abyssibacter sp. TaxID=2320200 RepID=UPI000C3BE8BA|nr:phage shock protein operon transcriptional activator [Abyssibacter sp.]MBB86407.1 phage shock protein operon transcriptional activator [Xanthomonadales bacterium]MCK5858679.1 phage shock protein operon transcriptional activator [Abyssibacter sp.]
MEREAESLIGESESFLDLLERLSQVAPLAKPVLVIGERGTGKELIAARLHYLSERWDRPFIKLNCAAINEELLESEMFGHVAGAYTGASKSRAGRFETADGGTLFLDELASMSLRLQEKLLRVVEYGQFERVGSNEMRQVDVRIIGAANVDLPAWAAEGRFREDLLDRLSFDVLTLPPLRFRPEDIVPLAEHFAKGMVKQLRHEYFAGFTGAASATLENYAWPGNVRELKNVVERAVYRAVPGKPVSRIEFDPFASPFRPSSRMPDSAPAGATTSAPVPEAQIRYPYDFTEVVAEFEAARLTHALDAHQHHQGRTAEALGLSYDKLRGLLRKHDIGR